jgi:ABC-type lipoprotein release transport system permease subunit
MAKTNNASFAEAARVAFRSLRSSKLRSFLTLLGIILATTTLISVMSVIRGMDDYIGTQVADMGVDGLITDYPDLARRLILERGLTIGPVDWESGAKSSPDSRRSE